MPTEGKHITSLHVCPQKGRAKLLESLRSSSVTLMHDLWSTKVEMIRNQGEETMAATPNFKELITPKTRE